MTTRSPGSARPAGRAGLDRFNALPLAEARQALLACCSSSRWAEQVAAARPYASAQDALRKSDEAVAGLAAGELADALSAHPRIGERPASEAGRWSRLEQAGVSGADQATRQELAASNAAYERRFGHLYLVCATGRSAAELLSLLRTRLANDPATEWHMVRSELGKINRIRLRKLIEENA